MLGGSGVITCKAALGVKPKLKKMSFTTQTLHITLRLKKLKNVHTA
jgi:hypothetical protein